MNSTASVRGCYLPKLSQTKGQHASLPHSFVMLDWVSDTFPTEILWHPIDRIPVCCNMFQPLVQLLLLVNGNLSVQINVSIYRRPAVDVHQARSSTNLSIHYIMPGQFNHVGPICRDTRWQWILALWRSALHSAASAHYSKIHQSTAVDWICDMQTWQAPFLSIFQKYTADFALWPCLPCHRKTWYTTRLFLGFRL